MRRRKRAARPLQVPKSVLPHTRRWCRRATKQAPPLARRGSPSKGGRAEHAKSAKLVGSWSRNETVMAKRPPALDRIAIKILVALQRNGRMTIQKTGRNGRVDAAALP